MDRDRPRMAHLVGVLVLLAGLACLPVSASAAKYASLVMDANTGRVLYARNADTHRYPASLTKMMTLYMVFEALEDGRLKLGQPISVSARAAAQPPSKLGIKPGRSIIVEDAILALVTKSANDIATAVAEELGGTERNFALAMTAKARTEEPTAQLAASAGGWGIQVGAFRERRYPPAMQRARRLSMPRSSFASARSPSSSMPTRIATPSISRASTIYRNSRRIRPARSSHAWERCVFQLQVVPQAPARTGAA